MRRSGWMRRRGAVLMISASLLTGCGGAGSERAVVVCPPLDPIPAELQARAADELAAAPPKPALGELVRRFAVLRDQVRACRG